jgi:hypothetical protein
LIGAQLKGQLWLSVPDKNSYPWTPSSLLPWEIDILQVSRAGRDNLSRKAKKGWGNCISFAGLPKKLTWAECAPIVE